MAIEILRGVPLDPARPVLTLGDGPPDDTYALVEDGVMRWQAAVGWGDHRHVPFREELIWPSIDAVVIGGGDHVHVLDRATGAVRARIAVPSLFGGLALDPGEPPHRPEALFIAGWRDLIALEPTLAIRWHATDLAIDGVIVHDVVGTVVRIGCEMDPPGGWFDVEVDALTGRELGRRPAFTEDYVGPLRRPPA
ncbi:MAG: hypothetical protein K8W52_29725 [Deltaproteobacteria bacterium]|nr:hypothetical protein [Deltaproteobacteria bacterium]